MILEIVNNLLLFVDPKKAKLEENRRRLRFKLAKKTKQVVKDSIHKMQVAKPPPLNSYASHGLRASSANTSQSFDLWKGRLFSFTRSS